MKTKKLFEIAKLYKNNEPTWSFLAEVLVVGDVCRTEKPIRPAKYAFVYFLLTL